MVAIFKIYSNPMVWDLQLSCLSRDILTVINNISGYSPYVCLPSSVRISKLRVDVRASYHLLFQFRESVYGH
jgi:hypothetical protein